MDLESEATGKPAYNAQLAAELPASADVHDGQDPHTADSATRTVGKVQQVERIKN